MSTNYQRWLLLICNVVSLCPNLKLAAADSFPPPSPPHHCCAFFIWQLVRDHTLRRWTEPVVFLCSTHLHILAELQFISALSSFIFPADGREVTEAAQKVVLIQHLHPDLLQVYDARSSDDPTPKYGAQDSVGPGAGSHSRAWMLRGARPLRVHIK